MISRPKPRPAEFDATVVRNISVAVYRARMGDADAAERIAKIGEAKFRDHAGVYDTLTRAYMRALRKLLEMESAR